MRGVAIAAILGILAAAVPAAGRGPGTASETARFTVSLADVPIQQVFRAIAQSARVSITVAADVQGQVTVHLRNVTLREAFDFLAAAYRLWIRRVRDGVYFVSRAPAAEDPSRHIVRGGPEVRVVRLRNASPVSVAEALKKAFGDKEVSIAAGKEEGTLIVRAPASIAAEIERAALAMDASAPPQRAAQPATPQDRAPQTAALTLRHIDAETAAKLVSASAPQAKITPDSRANRLLVVASPEDLERIRRALELVDVPVDQVLVETEVMAFSEDVQRALGVQWDLAVGTVIEQGEPVRLDPFKVVGALRAMVEQGRGRVLGRPRILTVSGKPANIQVGDQIFVPIAPQPGGAPVGVQQINAGMQLQVTPRVVDGNRIHMQLLAQANTLAGFSAGFPIVSSRSASTELVVEDGTPVVVGGLISEQTSTRESKIPLLGDIPIIGELFRFRQTTVQRQEVVIVVVPRIASRAR